MRRVPLPGLALALGLALVPSGTTGTQPSAPADLMKALGLSELREPAVAPDVTLTLLSGQPLRMASLRGKLVLVNFWATWCGPCKAEMPDLQVVYEQHRDELVVLAVNVEGRSADESRRLAQDFRDELGLTFPILLDTPDGEVFNQYKLKGLPASFFVDTEGIIRSVSIGPMSRETMLKKLDQTRKGGG